MISPRKVKTKDCARIRWEALVGKEHLTKPPAGKCSLKWRHLSLMVRSMCSIKILRRTFEKRTKVAPVKVMSIVSSGRLAAT